MTRSTRKKVSSENKIIMTYHHTKAKSKEENANANANNSKLTMAATTPSPSITTMKKLCLFDQRD